MKEYKNLEEQLINLLCEPSNYPFNKNMYSLYQTTNKINGMIYVGVHYSNKDKDRYMGSGTNIINAIQNEGKENFITEVLFEYNNERDMLAKEAEIVDEKFIARTDTYNICLGGQGFNMLHCITVKDKDGKTMSVNVNDHRYISGELVSVSKGFLPAKDKDGNTMQVSVNDPRYLSGELISVNKEMSVVKDKEGNTMQVSMHDPRLKSGELIHINIGMTTVKDKNGNFMKVSVDDPRIESGQLVSVTKGYVSVKDNNGNTMQVSVDDERYLSGELKHVLTGLVTVKDNNGNTMKVSINDERYLSGELKHISTGTVSAKNKDGKYIKVSIDDERLKNGELVATTKGMKMSKESREKMTNSKLGKKLGKDNHAYGKTWIYNTTIETNKFINKEELEYYLILGWNKGFKRLWSEKIKNKTII